MQPQTAFKKNLTQPEAKFVAGVYREHLSEASFLYEQRQSMIDDPEFAWQDLGNFEERLEAHLDGLVIGADLALEACQQQASAGDFGELHAAMRVFCRQQRLDLVLETIEAIDSQDAKRLQAVSDALNHELPEAWQNEFIGLLVEEHQKLAMILPRLIGFRRLPAGTQLLQTLQREHTSVSAPVIAWALGRLREPAARTPLLNELLRRQDEAFRSAAALALLRLGDPGVIHHCLRFAQMQNWPLIALALGGGRSTVTVVHDLAAAGNASSDCLLALGLLGDISVVDTLLEKLAHTELAESAARALNLITGADINEEVFIPEPIDEDVLFEEELKRLKLGEPLYAPGTEPGLRAARLSQRAQDWQSWWAAGKSRFDPEIRYRSGKPYSPAVLLENLASGKTPRRVRQWAYEELVIRYRADFPFETEILAAQQKQVLAKYAEWIKSEGSRFREGRWYFARQG